MSEAGTSERACAPDELMFWLQDMWLNQRDLRERAHRLAWARSTVQSLGPTTKREALLAMQVALAQQLSVDSAGYALDRDLTGEARSRATRDALNATRRVADLMAAYRRYSDDRPERVIDDEALWADPPLVARPPDRALAALPPPLPRRPPPEDLTPAARTRHECEDIAAARRIWGDDAARLDPDDVDGEAADGAGADAPTDEAPVVEPPTEAAPDRTAQDQMGAGRDDRGRRDVSRDAWRDDAGPPVGAHRWPPPEDDGEAPAIARAASRPRYAKCA